MMNERMRRNMEFIVEQQARFAASIERHEEYLKQLEAERIRDRPRLARLERSFQTVVELLKISESRLERLEFKTDANETRSNELEINMARLSAAQAHADERLSALIDVVMEDRGRSS